MTTDPKREALAAEVKRLAENYAVLDTKAARKALYAAIDALTAPSAGHGEGWVSVPKAMLEDWKERVNTISVLTLKDDRWKYGRALKQDIAHVLNNGPTPKDNRHE